MITALKPLMLFFITFNLASLLANEKSQKESKKNLQIKVEWFRPKLDQSDKKNRTRVYISGKTKPKAFIYIKSKVIPVVFKNNKIKFLKTKKALVRTSKKLYVKSDTLGYFNLILDLPNQLVQLPITVKFKDKSKKIFRKTFQLNLQISSQEAKILTDKVIQENPLLQKKFALWSGMGINFLNYTMSDSLTNDLSFKSFKIPSFYLKSWMLINDKFSTNIEYNKSFGEAGDEGSVIVDKKDYTWEILSADILYSPQNWRSKKILGNFYGNYSFRAGLQHHTVPFLDAQVSSAQIKTNSLGMLTLGLQLQAFKDLKWLYEIYFRYQHPIYSGSTFKVTPEYAFDGSLGGYYKYNKNLRLGLFWYGQIQKYKMSQIPGSTKTASQSLLFSNLEARIGYEW